MHILNKLPLNSSNSGSSGSTEFKARGEVGRLVEVSCRPLSPSCPPPQVKDRLIFEQRKIAAVEERKKQQVGVGG